MGIHNRHKAKSLIEIFDLQCFFMCSTGGLKNFTGGHKTLNNNKKKLKFEHINICVHLRIKMILMIQISRFIETPSDVG